MKDKMVYKGNNVIGALMNVPIFVATFSIVTDFAVLENMDAYRDDGMGDVIFGLPFLREAGIKTKRFERMITIYNGNDEVTYQMVRSHPRFKHHTNEQCNKIPPLLKVSKEDKMNGISHPYQKLKGFYKGVLNLGPDYIRDAKMEEWLTRGHISVHEMEERERKARTTLLMALPKDHLAKFHKMTDAKEIWEAIKSRFGGNDESKKMQKFQSLLSQLEIHGVGVSTEDANQKVFEPDVKGSTASSSSTQNVVFVSKNASSTNEVSTAYGASTSSGHNPQREGTSSYTNEIINGFKMAGGHDFYKTEEVLQKDRKKAANADLRGIKIVGGEMLDILGTKLKTVGGDLENRRKLKLCNSGSDTEVNSCSKECKESYAKLEKLYNEQREQLGGASIEIQIRFMKINLDDKTDVLTYHKKLLAKAEKEKEELKAKVEKWHNSSKGLNILLNSQMSARDKAGLSRSSDIEDSPVNDRYAEGMHDVPPPMTRIYIPSGPDVEIDESHVETNESVPKPVANEPKAVSDPKVWSDAPIIEEYESDSDDEHVSLPTKEQETPSFAFVNTVKHVKTPRQTVKEQNTCSQSPKPNKKDYSGLMSKKLGLGYGFTKKACFVCGSFSHLIRDCDFHEKRMAKQVELNKQKGKGTVQRENKPVWNNVQRLNHQNKFVPTAVLTRTGRFPINTASQAASTSTARKVNTVRPIVNEIRPRNNFFKSHSPTRRPFYKTTTPKDNFLNHKVNTAGGKTVSVVGGIRETADDPQKALKNKGIVDSGCSRHMTGNKAYLVDYQDYNGGPVAFGGSKCYITDKGKISTGKLDFKDVCFVKELQLFNLFSVLQTCDKKNKVLFTDTECLVLSPDFKLPDENQVLLRVPRQNNMYNFNLENIVPFRGLTCLIAKATVDESNKWHRMLGYVNFKNLNKLVKGNLVRGLPSKIFQNDHTCVAYQKGKQHKASCKAKLVSSISQPLQLLHMDIFGPTSIRSINHKTYCLVITDDLSRFSWVFFLRTKDETSGILKDFIRQIENQLNQKVKTIICDNGTEFKNMDIIELCGLKGIKREYSNARTPQQNGVAKRKNRTLIKDARTMLADLFLPNTFWAKAVSTASYVEMAIKPVLDGDPIFEPVLTGEGMENPRY
ncbi:ribonuclease H-like domain-containing protein [Tanacetum coccineum]